MKIGTLSQCSSTGEPTEATSSQEWCSRLCLRIILFQESPVFQERSIVPLWLVLAWMIRDGMYITSDVIYIHCYYAQHIDSCLLLEKYWLSKSKSHSSIVFLICLGSIWCWMLKAEGEVGCELLERVRRKRPGGFVTSPDPLFRTPFKLEGL